MLKERQQIEKSLLVQQVLRLKSGQDKSEVTQSQISRKRLLREVTEKLSKKHEFKREKSQLEQLKHRDELLEKEQAVLIKEARHEERLQKIKEERQYELELSYERNLLRQIDQRRNYEIKRRNQDKLKSRVLEKQFANEEGVRRLRSAMQSRSKIRHMSNEEMRKQKSLAKERLEDELSKLYKTNQTFLK